MKAEQLRKILVGKSKTISMRINPELLAMLDEAVEKDKDFESRNEAIEVLIIRYLESKGKLK
jgi:metal-responsive CopG/Arc/MetJ family transcriptional regulator